MALLCASVAVQGEGKCKGMHHAQLSALWHADQVVDKVLSPSQEHYSRVQFIWWLQYHLYLQLLRASDYCESKRVALKGDLPIGAVTEPPLRLHCLQAGCVPSKGILLHALQPCPVLAQSISVQQALTRL